uniref:Major sperm protein n=1 Tax=Caenorhabditis japonica TaxID=281687 RepID=A0A8R1HMU3_CAEJA
MALASNGRRRSIRSEHENAGGDNLLLQNSLTKGQNGITFAENRMNFDMTEGQEIRYFGNLIGNKEITIMTIVAISLYLINGEHAQTVCTVLTSIPPAVFSYRVLINNKTSKEGYHSILFYWTIYGILALIDQFCGTAQGYNLIKGGLLGAVFLHALRSNPTAVPRSWLIIDQATMELLSTVFTRIDSMGFIKKTESSGFVPRSPTMTHFSDDDHYTRVTSSALEPHYDINMIMDEHNDVSTACSFTPSLAMETTQKVSPGVVMKTATPRSLEAMEGEQIENDDEAEPPSTIRLNYKKPQHQFESMSAMTLTCSGPVDIITVPADRIVFSQNNREALIQVTNVSPLHVMFALKTNADTYLIAAPTTGVLLSGQTMTMRVGVTDQYFETCEDPGRSIDKIIAKIQFSHENRKIDIRLSFDSSF